jgi:hypothetical protein
MSGVAGCLDGAVALPADLFGTHEGAAPFPDRGRCDFEFIGMHSRDGKRSTALTS